LRPEDWLIAEYCKILVKIAVGFNPETFSFFFHLTFFEIKSSKYIFYFIRTDTVNNTYLKNKGRKN